MGYSFLEFWGERFDPGARGRVTLGSDHARSTWPLLTWARMIFLGIALPSIWYVGAINLPLPFGQALVLMIGGSLIYIALAYFIRPEPEMDNIGLAAGLIDHPGRWSDDWNRSLVSWQIVLGPGRFAAESLCDFVLLFHDPDQPEPDPKDSAANEWADSNRSP